jgi:predicted tellurium resistance membrane protein TerC
MTLGALVALAATVVLLDVDNAFYLTVQLKDRKDGRRLALILALLLEVVGRLFLIFLFAVAVRSDRALLTLGGIPITFETIALVLAGSYLILTGVRGLRDAFRPDPAEDEAPRRGAPPSGPGLPGLLAEMGLALTLMSVDVVLTVLGRTTLLWAIGLVFLLSALIRLLFSDQLLKLTTRYPTLTVVLLGLLVLIGSRFLAQALGIEVRLPFNGSLLLILLAWLSWRRFRGESREDRGQSDARSL